MKRRAEHFERNTTPRFNRPWQNLPKRRFALSGKFLSSLFSLELGYFYRPFSSVIFTGHFHRPFLPAIFTGDSFARDFGKQKLGLGLHFAYSKMRMRFRAAHFYINSSLTVSFVFSGLAELSPIHYSRINS
jgi:hypothetical protein